MRIAVSGTHCSGKSTLIEDFLAAHRDYVHEPEPHEWLQEMYGEVLADEPTVDDFYRQLELCVERMRGYGPGSNVIAERSALDFLAYILALSDLGRARRDRQSIESATELAAAGIENVDLLVILPLNERDGIAAPESEDLELRDAMNERLLELAGGHPRVIEISGDRQQRLRMLDSMLHSHQP